VPVVTAKIVDNRAATTYSFVASVNCTWIPAILAVLDPTANQRESQ